MDSERANGSWIGAGGSGTFGRVVLGLGASFESIDWTKEVFSDASTASGGDSTCCAVELKYRARLGRRNVGGNADEGIRMSKMDFLTVLLSILSSFNCSCACNKAAECSDHELQGLVKILS